MSDAGVTAELKPVKCPFSAGENILLGILTILGIINNILDVTSRMDFSKLHHKPVIFLSRFVRFS